MEGVNDPNRDFPYDYKDGKYCMRTIAARTINEIYREHMFQLAFTFHGGMEVLAYEWGAPTWLGHLSPDHEAQFQLGGAYSNYGGGFRSSKPYDYGTMNDKVYYVRGGMEDCTFKYSETLDVVFVMLRAVRLNSFFRDSRMKIRAMLSLIFYRGICWFLDSGISSSLSTERIRRIPETEDDIQQLNPTSIQYARRS